MKIIRILLISFLIMLLLSSPVINAQMFDWLTYQKDETRNGYSSENLFLPLRKLQEFNIGDTIIGSITIKSSKIFFTSKNGKIGSVSLFSDQIFWIKSLGEDLESGITLYENNIYVASAQGTVFCIAQDTGTIIWKTKTDGQLTTPFLKYFRYLYISSRNGIVYCINSLDGTIAWVNDLKSEINTASCLKLNYIFIITADGRLTCLESQLGKIIWEFKLDATSSISPVSATESIMAGDDDGNLYCFDNFTGRLIWQKKVSAPFTSSFTFAYFDKRILCAGTNGKYIGIGSGNGIELWSYSSDNTIIPPVGAGRLIFFPGSNNKLVAVDAFDGKSMYEENVSSRITSTLAISNGRVILGTESGKIIILGSAVYDFNLKITPEIQTVSPGSSLEYLIDANMTEGFKDPITFSVTGFPCSCKGVSRYFDKSSIIPPDNKIKLIIDTTTEAEPAKYIFSVTAYAGRDLKREVTGTIVVQKDTSETELSVSYPVSVKAGEDFIASVSVQNGKNIRSANFLINFPTDLLFVKDAVVGSYFSSSIDKLLIDKSFDNINGSIAFGVTKRDLGESGTGDIVRFLFRAKKPGKVSLIFSGLTIKDTFLNDVSYSLKGNELQITAGKQNRIELRIGKFEIKINEKAERLEAAPYIENGRTLVPIRKIAENCEAVVTWDNNLRKVTIKRFDKEIELIIDNPMCKVNGISKELPSGVPPRIKNGSTFLPIRFISEELEAKLDWISLSQTIIILYPGY